MMLIREFFCFKQKTAYEMRISDWSSDVCSSDLPSILDVALMGGDLKARIHRIGDVGFDVGRQGDLVECGGKVLRGDGVDALALLRGHGDGLDRADAEHGLRGR